MYNINKYKSAFEKLISIPREKRNIILLYNVYLLKVYIPTAKYCAKRILLADHKLNV